MIDYATFRRLRLTEFLAPSEITPVRDWEFEERMWVGEAHGFSEWLRLTSTPNELGSLAIAFDSFPHAPALEVLRKLDLPVRSGMKIEDLELVLGPPRRIQRFVQDRVTYEFTTTGSEPFQVSCTVLADGGLSYLGVRIPVLAEIDGPQTAAP